MKKIYLISLIVFFTSAYGANLSVTHDGSTINFKKNTDGTITLVPSASQSGIIKINDDFYSKRECKEFKERIGYHLDEYAIFDLRDFSNQRNTVSYIMFEGRQAKDDVTLLPYGVSLNDADILEKIKEESGLVNIKKINPGVLYNSIGITMTHGRKSILKTYPEEVVVKLLEIFEKKLRNSNEFTKSLSVGEVTFSSSSLEIMCDLLYFGSEIELDFTFQNPEEVVQKITVKESQVKKLFKKLKSKISKEKNLDAFTAGFHMANSIREVGFTYPAKLKSLIGPHIETSFYKAFFEDNFNWNVGRYTETTRRNILGRGYYVETKPGKSININSALDVEKK